MIGRLVNGMEIFWGNLYSSRRVKIFNHSQSASGRRSKIRNGKSFKYKSDQGLPYFLLVMRREFTLRAAVKWKSWINILRLI